MKVGDYVRTKKGTFDRFITSHTQDNLTWYTFEDRGNITNPENYIIKSSPNIIDLIEENDLLKIEYYSLRYKERLTRLFEVEYKSEKYLTLKNAHCDFNLTDNKFNINDKKMKPIIKSIVTKEQFESMEYKVGE